MLTIQEFKQRRQRLLSELLPNSVALIPAAKEITRSRDTEFTFRQDSDFYYLTGFNEPDAWLLLSNRVDLPAEILFCRPKDKMAEIWQGRRFGPELAEEQLDFERACSLDDMQSAWLECANGASHLYFAQGHYDYADKLVFSLLDALRSAPKQGLKAPASLMDIRSLIHERRLFKSDAEIEVMAEAGNISANAHKRAMKFAKPGAYEYQLEAELHHEFAMSGARSPAYGTIVGSGDNACILHYTENSDELKAGDLVLIDAGAELQGYAADITRTFPVSGQFSATQKLLYQLVLDAQLASFELIQPGFTLKQATDKACEVITAGLIELGLLQGELADNLEQQTYRQFFMHGLGHWLGLDVHDVGEYKLDGKERVFEPGMVLTVEPGLYISSDAEVDPKWRGIGIRIEDNLLITADGHRNLTQSVPKSIAEIEALMASNDTNN